jgi:plastocyanin
MRRTALATLIVLALGALVFATAGFGRSSATLKGTVGPGFTITLTKAGHRFTSIRRGTYTITVRDRSRIHNFVLEKTRSGDFEKRITTVAFVGTKTVTVRLSPGRWEFFCVPHESVMHHNFRVT